MPITGSTFLHSAVYFGNLHIVHLLLENGADIEASNNTGYSPLHHYCCLFPCNDSIIDTARLLVESGADVHSKNKNGRSVLESACLLNNGRVVCFLRFLLQNGAATDIDVPDATDSGRTLLHKCAIKSFHLTSDIIEALLEHGGNTKIKDDNGKLPLELACEEGSLSAVYVLYQSMQGDGSIHFRRATQA